MLGRSRWIRLVLLLVVVNGAIFVLLPRFRYRSIVIHHSASRVDNYASIREQHLQRGWSDAAYHLILSNGSTEIPAGHLEATERHRNASLSVATGSSRCNVGAIHLCVIGNYEEETFPETLQPALAHAVVALQRRYRIPRDKVELHRECSETLCPGKFVDAKRIADWLPRAAEVEPSVGTQQLRVLATAGLVPWRLTAPMVRAMGLGSIAAALIVLRWPRRRRRRRKRRPKRGRS